MFSFTQRVVMAATLVAGVACASGAKSGAAPTTSPSPSASPQGTTERPARRNSNTLTTADFKGLESLNVGDAIQRLRPDWLRRSEARNAGTISRGARGRDSNDALAVWVDENRAGGVEVLSQMAVTGISTVRYYSGPEAQSRFGNGNSSGAIHIVTAASGKKP
jgi:hypothetical protein